MDQKSILFAHMEDLAAKAIKTGYVASKFLTPAEARNVTERFAGRSDIALFLDGGYEGAERVRAVFLNPDWGEYEQTGLFTALKVMLPQREELGHRDILGALMSLGIDRSIIGDIIESPLAFLCLPELSGYITETFTKAGRTRVCLSEMNLSELPAKTENLTIKKDTVASLRLDAVLSAAFGLSRSKSAEVVEAGHTRLNHEICLRPTKEVCTGDVLSIQGKGRAKLLDAGGTTKKGRILIQVGIYGKSANPHN